MAAENLVAQFRAEMRVGLEVKELCRENADRLAEHSRETAERFAEHGRKLDALAEGRGRA